MNQEKDSPQREGQEDPANDWKERFAEWYSIQLEWLGNNEILPERKITDWFEKNYVPQPSVDKMEVLEKLIEGYANSGEMLHRYLKRKEAQPLINALFPPVRPESREDFIASEKELGYWKEQPVQGDKMQVLKEIFATALATNSNVREYYLDYFDRWAKTAEAQPLINSLFSTPPVPEDITQWIKDEQFRQSCYIVRSLSNPADLSKMLDYLNQSLTALYQHLAPQIKELKDENEKLKNQLKT